MSIEDGEEVLQLARAIMELTEASGRRRVVVGAALLRCVAGFYARLALDAGDSPEAARCAIYVSAHNAAGLAAALVRQAQAEAGR